MFIVKRSDARMTLLFLIWFGTLWGACEALFGGLLHSILPPTFPGKIMIALATVLMAFAVRRTGRSWMPLGMALVAAPLKLFSAVVFALPVGAPAVLNPALSILAQGAAFALLAMAFSRVSLSEPIRFGLVGAGAGALQSLVYVGLVRGPGLWLYPAVDMLNELGTKFPQWSLSLAGIGRLLSTSIPYAVLAAGVAALVAGWVLLRFRVRSRPPLLVAGTAVCLATFFLSSWLI